MSVLGKLASWWRERKQEQREIEQAQAEMKRAGGEADPPETEVLDEYDLGSLKA